MYTLVLDCAFKPIVSILENGKQLLLKESDNGDHSDNFMKLIDHSLKERKICLNDIDEIMLNVGPGSFTGLRVAVSIAKGFGFGDDKKIITFSSFDYINEKNNILVAGFSNFIYKKNIKNDMTCEDIFALNKEVEYVTVSDVLYEKLKELGFNIQYKEKLEYQEIYKNINKKYLKISELEPLYLRKSQAEEEREKKFKQK